MPEDSAGVGDWSRSCKWSTPDSPAGTGGGTGLAVFGRQKGSGTGGGEKVSAEAFAQGGGSKIGAAFTQGGGSKTDGTFGPGKCVGGAFGSLGCPGMAFFGKANTPAPEVLELTPAEAPPAAAVEELAPAEALLCPPTRAAISLASSHLPGQAASGFCQSGAKGCRP